MKSAFYNSTAQQELESQLSLALLLVDVMRKAVLGARSSSPEGQGNRGHFPPLLGSWLMRYRS